MPENQFHRYTNSR